MRTIIGVMGGARASTAVESDAERIGMLIARNGWVLLNGGRDSGVMAASARGARAEGGLVVGILPDAELTGVAPGVDIAIPTGMGDARNIINVLASRVVIALPGGAGTLSEIALALKSGRPVITVGLPLGPEFDPYRADGSLTETDTPDAAIACVTTLLHPGRP